MRYLGMAVSAAAVILTPLIDSSAQRALPRLTRVSVPVLESIGPESKAAQVAIASSGLIAFSGAFDDKKRALTVMDPKGNVVARFGAPGRGPGEILAPFQLAFSGDNIFVLEVAGRRASLFKKNGTPLATRPTSGSYYLVRATEDSVDVLDWPMGGGLPIANYFETFQSNARRPNRNLRSVGDRQGNGRSIEA